MLRLVLSGVLLVAAIALGLIGVFALPQAQDQAGEARKAYLEADAKQRAGYQVDPADRSLSGMKAKDPAWYQKHIEFETGLLAKDAALKRTIYEARRNALWVDYAFLIGAMVCAAAAVGLFLRRRPAVRPADA